MASNYEPFIEERGPLADGAKRVRLPRLNAVIDAARRVVDRVLATICIVTFVLLVIIVSWQVFTREVMNNSAPWTTEAAIQMFIVLSIFSIAYVFSEHGHIAVTMLIEKLPTRGQQTMAVIIEIIVMFFVSLVFIFGGLRVSANAWNQDLSTLPLTTGQIYLILPLAGVLILFYSITHIFRVITGAVTPLPEIDETAEAI